MSVFLSNVPLAEKRTDYPSTTSITIISTKPTAKPMVERLV